MRHYLFVYGTLRHGAALVGDAARLRAWLDRASDHCGPARMRGRLYRVESYPGLVDDNDAGWVAGDLLALNGDPAPLLAALDAYEECSPDFPEPHEYRRERLEVQGPDGPVQAWIYVYARETAELERIASGDWQDLSASPTPPRR